MTPREVTDADGTRWACVEAYAGLDDGDAGDAAPAGGGRVEVVCTPSGGAQTVRLRLASDWAEALDDDALLAAIAAVREARGDPDA